MRNWRWTPSTGDREYISQQPVTRGKVTDYPEWSDEGFDQSKPSKTTDDQPALIVKGGVDDGATITILKRTVTMGNLRDNNVVIDGPQVSRRHAEIVGTDDGFYLRDLGVNNLTLVNGEDIGDAEYLLCDGDQIRLGDSKISFVFRHSTATTLNMATPSSEEETETISSTADRNLPVSGDDGIDERLYEGPVKLNMDADSNVQLMTHFVRELRMSLLCVYI